MLQELTGVRPALLPENRPIGSSVMLDIVEWLSGDECHGLDDAGLIAGLGQRLRAAGLPLDRLSLHLRTLHPEIIGRSVAWSPGQPVEIHDREHKIETSAAFVGSPLRRIIETRKPIIVRPHDPAGPAWTYLDVLRADHLSELLVVPLCNSDGPVSGAVFSTARPEGFGASAHAALARIVPALRSACELRTLRRIERTLLDTYVGATTAQRILAGRIRRDQVETMETALLLCDLRGFTELSNRLPAERVLELLNAYFDRILPAIAGAGGEVLKFMGDAVLAFFPRADATVACNAALQAALTALDNLHHLTPPDATIHAGIALHYGHMSYGNIGSGLRLDFTMIGPDVNLVSRIQGVCSITGHPILMSGRFVELLESPQTSSIGHHALKGFSDPLELYVLCGP